MATEISISRRLHHIAMTRRMGPRLRGDDSPRFFASNVRKRGPSATDRNVRVYGLGSRACPRDGGDARERTERVSTRNRRALLLPLQLAHRRLGRDAAAAAR